MTSGGAGAPAQDDVRDLGEHWPSGVGGMQCDGCDEITIVRCAERDEMDQPILWLCLPCYRGGDDEY